MKTLVGIRIAASMLVLAGCGGSAASTTPRDSIAALSVTNAGVTSASAALVAPAPATPSAPATATPEPANPALFLVALCERAQKKDDGWIAAHVTSTVRGNVFVNREHGAVVGSIGSNAQEIASSLTHQALPGGSVCDGVTEPRAQFAATTDTDADWRGTVRTSLGTLRFSIVRDADVRRLAELSVAFAPHPVAARATRHAFSLDGRTLRASKGAGNAEGEELLAEIRRAPACVYEDAARGEVSDAIVVRVVKKPLVPAELRLYASTVVSESLLACLEGQLGHYAEVHFNLPLELEYFMHVLIPRTGPPEPGVPTLTIGPP
jgi:hypothetical protein